MYGFERCVDSAAVFCASGVSSFLGFQRLGLGRYY